MNKVVLERRRKGKDFVVRFFGYVWVSSSLCPSSKPAPKDDERKTMAGHSHSFLGGKYGVCNTNLKYYMFPTYISNTGGLTFFRLNAGQSEFQ
jgi:hypothetical protein